MLCYLLCGPQRINIYKFPHQWVVFCYVTNKLKWRRGVFVLQQTKYDHGEENNCCDSVFIDMFCNIKLLLSHPTNIKLII